MRTIFLCSDLDRTLIPNGAANESPGARNHLARLAGHPKMNLVYVTGRDRHLVEAAIDEYNLPVPSSAICDVGATIYHIRESGWRLDSSWEQEIGYAWAGRTHDDITRLLAGVRPDKFYLQPPEKQRPFKISYFADMSIDLEQVRSRIAELLDQQQIPANLICSVDDAENLNLIDILPPRANKLLAIRHLIHHLKVDEKRVVFAGDSGNDLDVLTSGMRAILVNNAADDVRRIATARLAEKALMDRLYLAKGGFKNMNGNYAAGVMEGLAHFFPETVSWF